MNEKIVEIADRFNKKAIKDDEVKIDRLWIYFLTDNEDEYEN